MSFKQFLITEIAADDVPLSLEYHKRLNPDLWTGTKLRAKVRAALLKIANEFFDSLETKDIEVVDVILTGSMANYNWTTHSDIDVHLIVNIKESGDDTCLSSIKELFLTKKSLWGETHDIKIFGHPVEVYVQLADENLKATGIYSVTLDQWVEKPNKDPSGTNFDKYAVKIKAADWMTKIDDAIDKKVTTDSIRSIKEKLRMMRRAGLQQGGEFSIENLTYKTLRDNGYIDKLNDYIYHKQDKDLSLS